jgi:hypothetical protein
VSTFPSGLSPFVCMSPLPHPSHHLGSITVTVLGREYKP